MISAPVSFEHTIGQELANLLEQVQKTTTNETNDVDANYHSSLSKISELTRPLFDSITSCYRRLGGNDSELFQAAPKFKCENFVFFEGTNRENVSHIILAKNIKKGFLQHGGGKVHVGECEKAAALREAEEEFHYTGSNLIRLTTESESGLEAYHFVKGINLAFVTSEEAKKLKLDDDMKEHEIHRMPLKEFVEVVEWDPHPIDHAFDRRLYLKYLKGEDVTSRVLTSRDIEIGVKALNWMQTVRCNQALLESVKNLIQKSIEKINQIDGVIAENWKQNRDPLFKACQKVVDGIVEKLLPPWRDGNGRILCQMKVAPAEPYKIDERFVPSFLTVPQFLALQEMEKGIRPETLVGKAYTFPPN